MATRILHCGKSIENYNLCIEKKVAGFTKRVADEGDLIYFAVKKSNSTICGARGYLSQLTIQKPWEDSERFVQAYTIRDLEYCKPFDLSILSEAGGKYWVLKYVQGSKEIKDEDAKKLLDDSFHAFKQTQFEKLDEEEQDQDVNGIEEMGIETNIGNIKLDDESILTEQIKIMGTFETIRFINETDPIMGLEQSVNNYFYELFPDFPPDRTLLIKDNKMFKTLGIEDSFNKLIVGIQGIPDALLIYYNKDDKIPLRIMLIEYECYGESKIKTIEKFNYLNGHIIPQLMRFASTFSIVTDKQIREKTIKHWTEKIIHYIYQDTETTNKFTAWVKELDPAINEQQIALRIHQLLMNAFQTQLSIILIIDELTNEQRDTIKNIIGSFKLENGSSVGFMGYVVRLAQKINIINDQLEYALSVQQLF